RTMTKVGKSDGEATFAGTCGSDEDAPTPAVRETGDCCPLIPTTAVARIKHEPEDARSRAMHGGGHRWPRARPRVKLFIGRLGGRLLREESNAISGRGRSRSAACIAGTGDYAARRNSHPAFRIHDEVGKREENTCRWYPGRRSSVCVHHRG